MSNFNTLNHYILPSDILIDMLNIYKFIGKNGYYKETLKKNIKKPNGAKPGMVIYETNNTIYVTPTEELVAKLKKQG